MSYNKKPKYKLAVANAKLYRDKDGRIILSIRIGTGWADHVLSRGDGKLPSQGELNSIHEYLDKMSEDNDE